MARCPYDSILAPMALKSLEEQYRKADPKTIPEIVDFCFNFDYHGVNFKPFQVKSEIIKLLELIEERKPKTIMEIGTAKGGTLFLFSKVAPADAKIISLDMGVLPFESSLRSWRYNFFKGFAGKSQKMELLWKDSHKQETVEAIKSMLNNEKVDFLFIDGDHTYEGVKRDFDMYSALVAPDGIIGLHDIVAHPPEKFCDVDKFFIEQEMTHKSIRLVENPQQGWGGIGLILPNTKP